MLTQTEQKWVDALTPYVSEHIEAGKPEAEAISLAMDDLQTIISEMVEQKTRRSKAAALALHTRVYLGLIGTQATNMVMQEMA